MNDAPTTTTTTTTSTTTTTTTTTSTTIKTTTTTKIKNNSRHKYISQSKISLKISFQLFLITYNKINNKIFIQKVNLSQVNVTGAEDFLGASLLNFINSIRTTDLYFSRQTLYPLLH